MRLFFWMLITFFVSQTALAQVFEVKGDTLIYNTDNAVDKSINFGHADILLDMLQQHKNIRLLKLHSIGGKTIEAKTMANIIIDAGLDTHVNNYCNSSCVRLFLAGEKRTASLGVELGFYRAVWDAESIEYYYEFNKDDEGWKTPFDFAAWLYGDVQKDVYEFITYLTDRGVSADIVAKTYRLGNDEMWYPRRQELLSSGILTE